MSRLRLVFSGLALAGVLAGLAALVAVSDAAPSTRQLEALYVVVIGWGFVGAGLFAWRRRPENRFGALMTAVGFAWFLAALRHADLALLHTVGLVTGSLWGAVLAHMLLAFPTGSLASGAERRLAVFGYAVATLAQVLPYLFSQGARPCRGCPPNLILLWSNPELGELLFNLHLLLVVVLGCSVAVVLARRWRRAGERERRALAPVLFAGGAVGVLVALSALAEALALPSVSDGFDWGYLTVLAGLPFAFVVGLVRSRFREAGALEELVDRLRGAGPGELRQALAEALEDPSLTLAYWVPESGRYVDEAGLPVDPSACAGRAWTPVELEGRPVAALIHDPALEEGTALSGDRSCCASDLIRSTGAAAALALERERLDAELRARLEELRASRARLVVAGDAERRRIERDLHDGAQQRIVSLLLNVRLARRGERARAERLLDLVEAELGEALGDLRALAAGILPPVLSDHGLGAAVDELAARSPVHVDVGPMPRERFPAQVEVAAYFVVAEALANVAKHAGASVAEVRVARRDGQALVEVRDDGTGGADVGAGSGLEGLADRVGALGGTLALDSAPGKGTTVSVEIPCGS